VDPIPLLTSPLKGEEVSACRVRYFSTDAPSNSRSH